MHPCIQVSEVDRLEPLLFPLLRRDLERQGPRYVVMLGDKQVDYNDTFRWGEPGDLGAGNLDFCGKRGSGWFGADLQQASTVYLKHWHAWVGKVCAAFYLSVVLQFFAPSAHWLRCLIGGSPYIFSKAVDTRGCPHSGCS